MESRVEVRGAGREAPAPAEGEMKFPEVDGTEAAYSPTPAVHAPRGVRRLSPAAVRLQRRFAAAVVVLPFLAVLFAAYEVFAWGVGPVEWGLLAGMYVLCILGTTVGFHRHFTHRAFKARRPLRAILAVVGSMAAQGPLLYWVASHRRHHAYSDQPGDPHSPNLDGGGLRGLARGLWHAHIGWMFSEEQSDWIHFARDVMQDRILFRIHQTYFTWVLLGLFLPAAAGGLLTGSWLGAAGGLLWGGLVRMFLVNHASWCVGSVCHVWGTRPFETRDRSANNYPVALFTFGEGLQNNHHAFQNSAAHRVAWWQPDFSMTVIRALEWVGLVWDVKVPTPEAIRAARNAGGGGLSVLNPVGPRP
jgi:stearoyl-CoA desaturase (delta-9 desaturase)